ncbi:ABC transporter permease [Bacillus sp. C1-1]|nr:ABC transporter permease [Bacillus sp. C1-1]
MIKFIIRRLIIAIPQLFVLSIFIYFLTSLMPGDAFSGMIDLEGTSPEDIERLRDMYGLNDPWYQQYWRWMTGFIQGDLGYSVRYSQPVLDVIMDRSANTLLLGVFALFFSYLLGIPLGIISGRFNDSWADKAINGFTYVGFAAPTFIFALIMLFVFGFNLGWFPTQGSAAPGSVPGTLDYYISKIHHLMLPSISLALLTLVGTVQYLRSEVIDVKHKEFVQTAKAKGANENRVYNKHIFRNSLLPIAAFFGYEVLGLITGSVFIERVFSFPGMGNLLISSISVRDFSIVSSLLLIFGFATIIGTVISDIILGIVDPRIRIK